MKRMFAIFAVLAVLPAGAALAEDDCRVSPEQMQSWEGVAKLADDYGWTITSMEIDDGCYEVLVTDVGGNTIKAKIDPATLDVIKAKIKTTAPTGNAPAAAPAN